MREQEVLKELELQKKWEQRLRDMANPRKGWRIVEEQEERKEKEVKDELSEQDRKWLSAVSEERRKDVDQITKQQIANFRMLWAIVDFVFS